MHNFRKANPLTFAAMVAFCAAAALADSLVAPVAVTAQSHYGDRAPGKVIDASGMSRMPANPVVARSMADVSASCMWLSSGTTDTWIMFDMGEEMTLTGMHVWNYNEARTGGHDLFRRGVRTCELRVGDSPLADGATYAAAGEWGTLKETLSLACATGAATGYEGEDVDFGEPLATRYVMLRVTANYGEDAFTGLSEVRFYHSGTGLVAPVAATAQSHYGDRAPAKAIDGSGMWVNSLVARNTADNTPSYMWLSNNATDTWIMFDMGEEMTLTGMHVWNYNEARTGGHDLFRRGVRTCELRVGDSPLADGATYAAAGEWGTLKETLSLACATGAATGYEGEDVDFGEPLATRYVMLRVTANYGEDAFTGLSEVRFYRPDIGLPISPVAATVESHFKGTGSDDRKASNTIDGSGMTPIPSSMPNVVGMMANVNTGNMWLSNGTTDTWIAFDLGEVKTVTGFHLWNYNESGSNFPKRGVKKAEVYVGDTMPPEGGSYANAGAAWGTLVETMEFVQAPGAAGYLGEDYQFQTPVTGRYFQFVVKEKHDSSDRYTGISEILFYEAAQEMTVTRLSSGAKTIPDGTVVAVVDDGEGVAAPIAVTDGARVRAIRAEASGGMPQIDPNGGTLAMGTIDLPAGSAGLEIMPGNVTGLAEMRRWLEWRLDSDLVMHADLADEAGGAVGLWKTGPGTLVFDGSDTRTGDNWFSGGVFRQTGGSLDIPGGTFVGAKAEFLGGTSRATGSGGFALVNSSSMTVAGEHSAEWSMLQPYDGDTALAVRDGGKLKLGTLGGAPDSFKIDIDGGTIGPSALRAAVPWLPALGPIRVGEGGAVFDTSDRDAIVDAAIEGEAGGAITKIGANTLTLRCSVANAGPVHIKEGTLKLVLPQAVAVNVLNPESDLSIDAGAKLDLGGTDQTVATLTLKGRLRRLGPTTWGAIGSGAAHETDMIVGEGILRVAGPARSGLAVIVK